MGRVDESLTKVRGDRADGQLTVSLCLDGLFWWGPFPGALDMGIGG